MNALKKRTINISQQRNGSKPNVTATPMETLNLNVLQPYVINGYVLKSFRFYPRKKLLLATFML